MKQPGDTFNRNWTGDVAQCGCRWALDHPDFMDVARGWILIQCPLHKQASDALVRKFERERKAKCKSYSFLRLP